MKADLTKLQLLGSWGAVHWACENMQTGDLSQSCLDLGLDSVTADWHRILSRGEQSSRIAHVSVKFKSPDHLP